MALSATAFAAAADAAPGAGPDSACAAGRGRAGMRGASQGAGGACEARGSEGRETAGRGQQPRCLQRRACFTAADADGAALAATETSTPGAAGGGLASCGAETERDMGAADAAAATAGPPGDSGPPHGWSAAQWWSLQKSTAQTCERGREGQGGGSCEGGGGGGEPRGGHGPGVGAPCTSPSARP